MSKLDFEQLDPRNMLAFDAVGLPLNVVEFDGSTWVVGGFGYKQTGQNSNTPHAGEDSVPNGAAGNDVFAIADGTIIFSGQDPHPGNNDYGNVVIVEHRGDGTSGIGKPTPYYSVYGHMASVLPFSVSGSMQHIDVAMGTYIGKLGELSEIGHATDPHLHLNLHNGLFPVGGDIDGDGINDPNIVLEHYGGNLSASDAGFHTLMRPANVMGMWNFGAISYIGFGPTPTGIRPGYHGWAHGGGLDDDVNETGRQWNSQGSFLGLNPSASSSLDPHIVSEDSLRLPTSFFNAVKVRLESGISDAQNGDPTASRDLQLFFRLRYADGSVDTTWSESRSVWARNIPRLGGFTTVKFDLTDYSSWPNDAEIVQLRMHVGSESTSDQSDLVKIDWIEAVSSFVHSVTVNPTVVEPGQTVVTANWTVDETEEIDYFGAYLYQKSSLDRNSELINSGFSPVDLSHIGGGVDGLIPGMSDLSATSRSLQWLVPEGFNPDPEKTNGEYVIKLVGFSHPGSDSSSPAQSRLVARTDFEFSNPFSTPLSCNSPCSSEADLLGIMNVVQTSPNAGDVIQAQFSVSNNGGTRASGFFVDFMLSDDSNISVSDEPLGRVWIPALDPLSDMGMLTKSLPLPGPSHPFWTGNGNYFIGMVIDPENAIPETDEVNNLNRGLGIDIDSINVSGTSTTLPTISVNDPELIEPQNGSSAGMQFLVTLDAATSQTVTVNFATSDVLAAAGQDYDFKDGQVTFNPGQTQKPVIVTVRGDLLPELHETFHLNLFNPTNSAIADSQGVATIRNDDSDISIDDLVLIEGDTPNNQGARFLVTITANVNPVSVDYATLGGSTADYDAVSGTLVFSPGQTVRPIIMPVFGDDDPEDDEFFYMNLSNASSNAVIQDSQGQGKILDDDPIVSIDDANVIEGDSGQFVLQLGVYLSRPVPGGEKVQIQYATANGSATAGVDYVASIGTIEFNAGATFVPLIIPIIGDEVIEVNETIVINLSGPSAGVLGDSQAIGTILDDDFSGEIYGTAFIDVNGDGIRQIGEPGAGNRSIYLDQDNDGSETGGEVSTATNHSGQFALAPISPDTYLISQTLPSGWEQSHPTLTTNDQRLLASIVNSGDQFGYSVDISGDLAVVGSPFEDGVGTSSGIATVFQRSGLDWVEIAQLTASDAVNGAEFGYDVATDGNTIIVGAPDKSGNDGAVYVFEEVSGIWTEVTRFLGAGGGRFGLSVDVHGDRFVVGAPFSDIGFSNAGSLYTYERSGSTWLFDERLNASDATASDTLGRSVAIHQNRIVAGANGVDDNGNGSGAAYVFDYSGSAWQETQKLIASDGDAFDDFGWSVGVHDDLIVVGTFIAGKAYVFENNGSSWTEEAALTGDDSGDQFGHSVAVDNGVVVIGARFALGDSGQTTGAVYGYEKQSTWTQVRKYNPDQAAHFDAFGQSVSNDGITVFAGAPASDDSGTSSGAAYSFSIGDGGDPSHVVSIQNDTVVVGVDFASHAINGFDFGDAPDTYGTTLDQLGAFHAIVSGLYLGSGVSPETDGQPDSSSNGEQDVVNDGVVFVAPLRPGFDAVIEVSASMEGILQAWFDWNGDGDWNDIGEHTISDLNVVAGTNSVNVGVPGSAVEGLQTHARFRISTAADVGQTGFAPDGEVEDYQVIIADITSPNTVSFARFNPNSQSTSADSLVFRATFDESVQNVDAGDFIVSGTTAGIANVSFVSTGVYDLTVSGGDLANLDGIVGLNLAPGTDIEDLAGNDLVSGEPAIDEVYLVDNTDPSADILDVTPDPRGTNAGVVTIVLDEDVTGLDIGDFTLTRDGQVVDISGLNINQVSPGEYTVDLSSVTGVEGSYELTLNSSGSGIQDNAGNPLSTDAIDQFMVDLSGPTVESVVINGGDNQRSMVTEISVMFSEIVNVNASSLILQNTDTGSFVTPIVSTKILNGKTIATLTFGGTGIIGGSLADGNYTLTILDSITDTVGNQLDGDEDGNPGGNATDDLFRKFGDITGDGNVNILDFVQFRNAFGSSTGSSNFDDAFDFNGDGQVNILDFIQFRSRFGS